MTVELVFFTVLMSAIYFVCLWVYRKQQGFPLLHPVFTSPILVGLVLWLVNQPIDQFLLHMAPFSVVLELAIVALAIPIYRTVDVVRRKSGRILWALPICSFLLVLLAVGPLPWIVGDEYWLSFVPKSTTTPVAFAVSDAIGGVPSLSVISVAITGALGAFMGPYLLNKLRVSDRFVRGFSLGLTSHAFATAKLLEEDTEQASFSALAMALNALITAIWVPLVFSVAFFNTL
jgi:putative effector of murein hydrolase